MELRNLAEFADIFLAVLVLGTFVMTTAMLWTGPGFSSDDDGDEPWP